MSTSTTATVLSPAELATRIVQAAGHPEQMIENLAAEVICWITPSIPPEVMASFTTVARKSSAISAASSVTSTTRTR